MKLKPLGRTSLVVSELGFGCARIGGIFQGDQRRFVDLLSAVRDAGINFFDTADIYSQGESEALIGRVFRGQRDRIVIATKAGYRLPSRRRWISRLKPLLRPVIRKLGLRRDKLPSGVSGKLSQDFSPLYLRRALEGSLKRLRTDYVDLLQLHSPSRAEIERGDWLPALDDLKRSGKIRYYGISVDDEPAGVAALGFGGVSSLQLRINLLDRGAAATLVPRAHGQAVGVIARESLANGMLVKPAEVLDLAKYCSSPEQLSERERALAALREQAGREGRSLARLAVDFTRGLEGVAVTLLGASNEQQFRELMRDLA